MAIEPALGPIRSSMWAPLYKVGAASAFAIVGLMVVQLIVFVVEPPPGFLPSHRNAHDWILLLQTKPLLGLLHLDGLLLVSYVFVLLLYLTLWVTLRGPRPVTTLVAFVFCAVGTAVYMGSNPAFTMLALADQYAVASGDIARLELLAAAQAALAVYHGTPFDVGYALSAIAGLLICSAMLGTGVFRRRTAYVGIAAYAMNLVPATAGTLGFVLSIVSLIPLALWLLLVGRRLWALG